MLYQAYICYRVTLPPLLHISKCSVLFDSTSNKFMGTSLVKILVDQRSTWQSIRNPSFQSCTFSLYFLCAFYLSLFRSSSLFFWVRRAERGRHITYLWFSYFQHPVSILVFIFGEWKTFVMESKSCVVAQTDATRCNYYRRAELLLNTMLKLGSSKSHENHLLKVVAYPRTYLLHAISKLRYVSLDAVCSVVHTSNKEIR